MCVWACLKSPPRFEVNVRPGNFTVAAVFDRTAAGVKFGDLQSNHDQIRVPAQFDLAAVEVDYGRLAAATGFESAGEAEEIWESIKRLVKSGPSTTTVSEPVEDVLNVEHESGLVNRSNETPVETAEVNDLNGNNPRHRYMIEKTGGTLMVVLKIPSIKHEHSYNNVGDDRRSFRDESSRGTGTNPPPIKTKGGSNGKLAWLNPGIPSSSTANLPPKKKLKFTLRSNTKAPEARLIKQPRRKIKRKHNPTSAADDASSPHARSSGVRDTAPLPSKSKHNSSSDSRPGRDLIDVRSTATHPSAGQDKSDSATASSKTGKRKVKDGPSGGGNTPQTPVKRRMAMKEESFRGSQ